MDNNTRQQKQKDDIFSLKDFLSLCLGNWQWIAGSVILFCFLGALYAYRQQPVYQRTESIMIKNMNGGQSSDLSSAFSSMGLLTSSTSVNNELISMTSPAVMREVVTRLRLNINYETPGILHPTTLYGTTLPIELAFPTIKGSQPVSLKVILNPDGSAVLHDFETVIKKKKYSYDKRVVLAAGASHAPTPVGDIVITRNPLFKEKITEPMTIEVSRRGIQSTTEAYMLKVSGDLHDREAEVIDLTAKDVSIERADDVLNTIVAVYNERWVEDKNMVAVATSNFINDRLLVIEKELGVVDSDISEYKSANMIPDIEETSRLYLDKTAKTDTEILDITNKLAMARYVRDFVNNPAHANQVLPINTGIGDMRIETQIADYNKQLLARNNLVANSSEQNPIVRDLDTQLRGEREAIVSSINSQVTSLTKTLRNLEASQGRSMQEISASPTQAKNLLSFERQQKVKESLYLYLLQKREENELSQSFNSYNTRIITPPMGSDIPIKPKKMLILATAFVLGVAFPCVILIVLQNLDTKVRSRKDLEDVIMPYAGEIPDNSRDKKRNWLLRLFSRRKKGPSKPIEIVVEEGNRNVINEAFRVVRSNIEFMSAKNQQTPIVAITSFNPGSGKSFISANLASSFALKGKRVLLIDGDLRHGSSSRVVGSPRKGISDYLSGGTDNWEELTRSVPGHQSLSVLPIGHEPPNPAELLENGRLGELLDKARHDFDIVLIDCPPIDIVVDTQIIDQYTDSTLFVVRAGLLDKQQVPVMSELYSEKRFKNLSYVINGTAGGGNYYSQGKSYYTHID